MYAITVLLVAVCAVFVFAQRSEDPLCVEKGCPSNTTCRVVTECATPDSCTLRAECLENPPKYSHTGVCQIGQPILVMREGALGDTYCGYTLPCPNSTYCNTELMDTYATCCRSDPANTVNPGRCPVIADNDTTFCSENCNNDGDCRHNFKCCQVGCRRRCLPPVKDDACATKKCPEGTYCLTSEMPSCTDAGRCYSAGDCVPCGPMCRMQCPYGFEKDTRGCTVCTCKPQPVQ